MMETLNGVTPNLAVLGNILKGKQEKTAQDYLYYLSLMLLNVFRPQNIIDLLDAEQLKLLLVVVNSQKKQFVNSFVDVSADGTKARRIMSVFNIRDTTQHYVTDGLSEEQCSYLNSVRIDFGNMSWDHQSSLIRYLMSDDYYHDESETMTGFDILPGTVNGYDHSIVTIYSEHPVSVLDIDRSVSIESAKDIKDLVKLFPYIARECNLIDVITEITKGNTNINKLMSLLNRPNKNIEEILLAANIDKLVFEGAVLSAGMSVETFE
jgi:hypothetical protein